MLNHQASYILKDSVDNDSHMHHLATIISREYNIHELLGIKPGSPLTNEEIEKLDLILSNGDEAIKTKTVTCDVTDAPSKGAVWAALTHADTEFMSPLTIDAVETNLNSIGLYSEVRLTVSDSIEWTPTILKHASVMDPETIFSVPYSEMERKSVIITYHIPIAEIFHDMIGSLIVIALLSVFLIVCLLLQFSTILKLTRLDNIRNSFVTTMIHELKRPISTLKMCVSGIENEHMMKDKETRQDLLRETRNSLDNLSAYFSKLRDITFNNVEQIPLNIQQVSLHNLLDEVTATMTNPADKNVDIINEIDMNLEVSADKTHLMNIINNLIENAVKYSGQDVEFQLGDTIFRPNLSSITYGGETHSLSVRQSEILQMLADNKGRLIERDHILERIWGDASYSNSLALNVQITYLRRLLTDPKITITSIKKKGYILTADQS